MREKKRLLFLAPLDADRPGIRWTDIKSNLLRTSKYQIFHVSSEILQRAFYRDCLISRTRVFAIVHDFHQQNETTHRKQTCRYSWEIVLSITMIQTSARMNQNKETKSNVIATLMKATRTMVDR